MCVLYALYFKFADGPHVWLRPWHVRGWRYVPRTIEWRHPTQRTQGWRGGILRGGYPGAAPIIAQWNMMTSSNGNIFRITGHLCGEFTGPRVNSPHKGQWRGDLMYSLICVRISGGINNSEAGDLRRHRAHYDVSVMIYMWLTCNNVINRQDYPPTLSKKCLYFKVVSPFLNYSDSFSKKPAHIE